MFGKAKCKLCGQSVRFTLRHLKQQHPETLGDKDIEKLKMENIMKKYFTCWDQEILHFNSCQETAL